PVVCDAGAVQVDGRGAGEVVEWAVKMVRLPAEATLKVGLERRTIGSEVVTALARRVAEFHATAERSPTVARSARFAEVARTIRENFTESEGHVGTTVSRPVFERLRTATERALEGLRDTIASRAARGVPCDTHGDLRLDHVYLLPGKSPTAASELVIIDAIEF